MRWLAVLFAVASCGRIGFESSSVDAPPGVVRCDPTMPVDPICDDVDACSIDTCDQDGVCGNAPLIGCANDDRCCPLGCGIDNDNDCAGARPTVQFTGPGSVHVDETAGTIDITVVTSAPLPYDASVRLFAFGEATLGIDYRLDRASIVVPANSTTGTLSIPIVDDGAAEGWERIQLDLDGSSAFILGEASFEDIYIVDDEQATPRPVIDGIAVGADHTCYLANGGVACFGSNFTGQLGDGTMQQHPEPVVVFPAGSGVTQIDAAGGVGIEEPWGTTCAVKNAQLWCWGWNIYGQVGDNSMTDRTTPVLILSGGVTKVAVGTTHACLLAGGSLACWGSNAFGQVGIGTVGGNVLTPTTIVVNGVTDVEVSAHSTCAVVAGGVQCWGSNDKGHLGDGTSVLRPSPTTIVPLGTGVTQVAVGTYTGCAIQNGALVCWGMNYVGSMGIGLYETFNDPQQYTPRVIIPSGVTAVGGGESETCAVVNGGLQCTGRGVLVMTEVGFGPNSGVTTVQASSTNNGDGENCALVTGRLYCWAHTFSMSRIHGKPAIVTQPVEVLLPPGDVTALASPQSSFNYGFATVVGDRLYGWGNDQDGWIGAGSTTWRTSPIASIASGAITALANGDHANTRSRCAIIDGGVACMGDNAQGQLGDGTTSSRAAPAFVTGLGRGAGVTAIAGYLSQFCAVIAGGVSCWGRAFAPTPMPLYPAGSNVTGIALAPHSCAVRAGGIECWGANDQGQLGNGTMTTSAIPVTAIAAGSGATAVGVHGGTFYSHTCAIVSGAVWCWGANAVGELGDGSMTPSTVPRRVSGPGTATTLDVANGRTCAVYDGGLRCWGAGFPTLLPTELFYPAGSGVTAISLGEGTADCAIVNARAWCWGTNRWADLGQRIRQYRPFEIWSLATP